MSERFGHYHVIRNQEDILPLIPEGTPDREAIAEGIGYSLKRTGEAVYFHDEPIAMIHWRVAESRKGKVKFRYGKDEQR